MTNATYYNEFKAYIRTNFSMDRAIMLYSLGSIGERVDPQLKIMEEYDPVAADILVELKTLHTLVECRELPAERWPEVLNAGNIIVGRMSIEGWIDGYIDQCMRERDQ